MNIETKIVHPFDVWLTEQIGPCQWMVGRSSKKRREKGYDRFFTQKNFSGLKRVYDKEVAAMGSAELHLTEPDQDLAEKRRRTPPGMAFWAGTGPAGATCRGCQFWLSDGYLADCGLLKDSICGKYRSMMNGEAGAKLSHYTPACKYFAAELSERPLSKRK